MDDSLFVFINNPAGEWWPIDWLGIFLAEYLAYLLILTAIFLFLREKSRLRRIYFFALAALSVILARGIIAEPIRFFNYRPRPFLVLGFEPLISHSATGSFPSGHAAAFFALALVVYFFDKQWGWRFLAAALLMGIARIFVGVHWPTDILAGALIGAGSGVLIKKILPATIALRNKNGD